MTLVVVDASSIVEFARTTDLGARVAARIAVDGVRIHLPHVCAIEVTHAMRGLVLGGKLAPEDAECALATFLQLVAHRHPAEPLLRRIWQLRDNLTAYDAVYVALAELLAAPLITTDAKFDTPTVTRLIDVEVIS